jgi:hypothetical protein
MPIFPNDCMEEVPDLLRIPFTSATGGNIVEETVAGTGATDRPKKS